MGFLSTIWSWIYHGSGFLMVYFVLAGVVKSLHRTPMRKLKFLEAAYKDGRTSLGKVSSYIVYGRPQAHEVEYAYEVNGKIHFTTYVIHEPDDKIDPKEELQNGDGVATYIPSTITVYYDAKNPNKTVVKGEVFASRGGMRWQKTKKKNKYRDIYKDWTGPVNL